MAAQLYHDYACATCGAGQIRVPHGTQVRGALPCVGCGRTEWKWIRTITQTYVAPNHFGTSAALDVHVSDERIAPIGKGIRVDTLRDIRRLERESEKMEADGVGQAVRFRKYSSNDIHTNSFGEVPQPKPSFTRADGRPRMTIRLVDGDAVEDVALGPGVTAETQFDPLASGE